LLIYGSKFYKKNDISLIFFMKSVFYYKKIENSLFIVVFGL